MPMIPSRLGEVLVNERIISREQLEKCLAASKKSELRLVEVLVAEGVIDEQSLLRFLSKQYRLPVMDLSNFTLNKDLTKLLPAKLMLNFGFIPVGRRGDTLVIGVSDPTNIQLLDDVRFNTRLRVEQVLVLPSVIRRFIEKNIGGEMTNVSENAAVDKAKANAEEENTNAGSTSLVDDLKKHKTAKEKDGKNVKELAEDADVIKFVAAVLEDAVKKKASDIHIEPYEKSVRIRFRIDGDLIEAAKPHISVKEALVARVKVMSNMRLDEKRLPQDGRIRLNLADGTVVDFRVNSLPTVYGEKVVLRILDKANAVVEIDKIGFENDDLNKFIRAVQQPWGICLVCGATGSGKTTTLYAAINAINTPDINISTIEDPVEYNFQGINQVQVKEKIGLTFAETLRALLRQDPDVILLGEIRDAETATVAFKAAMTGHLVLSTLHTNDAASTIMRLKDMGVDTFMINSALQIVISQRLVRRLCTDCKIPDPRGTPEFLKSVGFPANVIGKFQPMKGKGCAKCRDTGTRGRAPIHEVMVLSDTLREKIGNNCSTEELRKQAMAEGMKTLRINCMRKIMSGVVSLEELKAVGGE